MFQYGIIVYPPIPGIRIHQETNYENPTGNLFENEKSDNDDEMVSDFKFNDDRDIE